MTRKTLDNQLVWMICPKRHLPRRSKQSGYSILSLSLQPVNNQATTYMITTTFEGDLPLNSTAWAYTLDGQRTAACTTIQNGYKPASNMTSLTVDSQATEASTQTKTPEQMQQEAQSSGWLKPPRPWFNIFYPWFRLYFTAVLNGQDLMDVGLSPLGYDEIIVYQRINSWVGDAISELIIKPVAQAYFIGWILTEIAAYAGMYFGPTGFAIALAGSILSKYILLRLTWDSVEGLKGSFVGALFSWAYGYIKALQQVVTLGITGLTDFLKLSGLDFWKLLFKFIYIPIHMIFLIQIILRVVQLGGWQL